VTIRINNDGNESISTMPDCWEFVSNGTSYYYDESLTPNQGMSDYEVKPGETYTFQIVYVIEDKLTISYLSPYLHSLPTEMSNLSALAKAKEKQKQKTGAMMQAR